MVDRKARRLPSPGHMSDKPEELVDVTIHSPRTRMRGVRAPSAGLRPWIEKSPVCQALSQHQIIHVGIQEAVAPMKIVRTKQTTAYFLACFGGRGRVLVDGRWRICREGFACLLPAHTLNAFEAIPGVKWEFCWACYQRPAEQRPVADITSPVMARYEPLPLHSAILGLMYECSGPGQPTLMQEWADLIHAYVLRFAQPSDQPDALRLLWERVAGHLGKNGRSRDWRGRQATVTNTSAASAAVNSAAARWLSGFSTAEA